MLPRRSARGRSVAWTLVLATTAFLALSPSLAVVAPRARSAAATPAAAPEPGAPEPPGDALLAPPIDAAPRVATGGARARGGDVALAEPAPGPAGAREPPALAQLVVRVTAADGAAAHAAVELVHTREDGAASTSVAATDAVGVLALALAPGSVRAVAWSADATAPPAAAALAAGETAELALVLEPAYPVAGRVTDAATGAPVAGARVAFWTFAESDAVETAADGTFRHPRFPAGAPAQQVCASAPGRARSVRYLRIDGDGRWRLAAAAPGEPSARGAGTPWLELALWPELRVRGRVVGPDGRPVAGVRVAADGFVPILTSVASRDRAEALGDADGAFELAALRPDVAHVLTLAAPGLAFEPLALAPGASGAVLELGALAMVPSALVCGAVVDEAGVPLAGVEVVLRVTGDDGAAGSPASAAARLAREHKTRTGPEGAFALEGFTARPVTLTVEHAGGAAEIELHPRPDGSFDSPVITPSPPLAAAAPRAR